MAWIRACGGATKSKIIPLYDSGNECVSLSGGWTSSNYTYRSSYTKKADVVKNVANMLINCGSTNAYFSMVGTKNPIDVTDYIMVRVYLTVNNIQYVETLDVTSIVGSGYLSVAYVRDTSGSYISDIILSNDKTNVMSNLLKHKSSTHTGSTVAYINKIELVPIGVS